MQIKVKTVAQASELFDPQCSICIFADFYRASINDIFAEARRTSCLQVYQEETRILHMVIGTNHSFGSLFSHYKV